MSGIFQTPFHVLFIFLDNTLHKFWDQPLHPIINVVCKYLGQFLVANFGVASLPTYCNIDSGGTGLVYFCKVDHSRVYNFFSGTDLVLIIYLRYCSWFPHKVVVKTSETLGRQNISGQQYATKKYVKTLCGASLPDRGRDEPRLWMERFWFLVG